MSLGMNGAGLATAGAATLLGPGGVWRGATGLVALRAGSRASLFGISMRAGASSLSCSGAAAGSAEVGADAANGGAWGESSGAGAGAATGGGGVLVAADREVAL